MEWRQLGPAVLYSSQAGVWGNGRDSIWADPRGKRRRRGLDSPRVEQGLSACLASNPYPYSPVDYCLGSGPPAWGGETEGPATAQRRKRNEWRRTTAAAIEACVEMLLAFLARVPPLSRSTHSLRPGR